MVQLMETWILIDVETLRSFYGQDFNENSIPRTRFMEEIDRDRVMGALEKATRNTRKGVYHKIRHASALLQRLDATKVRQSASSCDRLFTTLEQKIEAI